MNDLEISPAELEASRVHHAFEYAADPVVLTHSAGVFELLSHVPCLRILDNAPLKDRIAKTLTSKGDTLTARLDPEKQETFQLSAEIQLQDSDHIIAFRYKKNNQPKDAPGISYSLIYDAKTGDRRKVIIAQPGTRKRLGVHIESDDECAACSIGGRAPRPIRPLTQDQLDVFMESMMRGTGLILPGVWFLEEVKGG